MKKVIAIHQPNFFPWIGYFDKISRSDAFVFLDDVQYPKKSAGTWSNRVKFLISGEPRWLTATIDRKYEGTRTYNEMFFIDNNLWREKCLRSIEHNYRKHTFYSETIELLAPLILNKEANVSEYNIRTITAIMQRIGMDTNKLHRSSNLGETGSSNEQLCSITKRLSGNVYMCGGGADGYQDDSIFERHGIELVYQNFQPSTYPHRGYKSFHPGLSIIDGAMNLGWAGTKQMLQN